MRQPRAGSLFPCRQVLVAASGIGRAHSAGQPFIELVRHRTRGGPECAEIMKAHPAADNQHTFTPQRGQRPADTDVILRIETLPQRELYDRNICIRVNQLERDEYTVIETTSRILLRRE